MLNAEAILSLMLSLQPPGLSVYSVVEVADGAPAPCAEASILCDPPKWDKLRDSFVRYETWAEGLGRYWIIAQALSDVAGRSRWMAQALLVAAYHESGFRGDVHTGSNHDDPRGTIHEDKGASWCLIQRNLGRKSEQGPNLVGVDYWSTRRCFEAGAEVLQRARWACAKWERSGPICWFAVYGGVTNGARDKRIQARAKSWRRIDGLPTQLSAEVLTRLGIEVPMLDDV